MTGITCINLSSFASETLHCMWQIGSFIDDTNGFENVEVLLKVTGIIQGQTRSALAYGYETIGQLVGGSISNERVI